MLESGTASGAGGVGGAGGAAMALLRGSVAMLCGEFGRRAEGVVGSTFLGLEEWLEVGKTSSVAEEI